MRIQSSLHPFALLMPWFIRKCQPQPTMVYYRGLGTQRSWSDRQCCSGVSLYNVCPSRAVRSGELAIGQTNRNLLWLNSVTDNLSSIVLHPDCRCDKIYMWVYWLYCVIFLSWGWIGYSHEQLVQQYYIFKPIQVPDFLHHKGYKSLSGSSTSPPPLLPA